MVRLNELAAKLSSAELSDLESYAEMLVARHESSKADGAVLVNRIRLDELEAMLTRLDDELPWSEIKKRISSEMADAAED